jgi:Trk K+ transport system NAD-binding subunit
VKYLTPQITYLLTQREYRRNIKTLLQYLGFLGGTVVVYSLMFHGLMLHEGQQHSWLTGFYWTLTVMSTLGFGDITFHTDLGRLFSMTVLLSGIVLLLIVLPFVFIRSFYAPWLEAQLRLRAPREAPEGVRDHVILCRYDEVAAGLVRKLRDLGVAYYVIEPDAAAAATLHGEGVSVVTGDLDSVATYRALRVEDAKLVVANLRDAENSNIALTVREQCEDVPIAAFAEEMESVDVLELSGASHVLPLKHQLGEYLASRVTVGPAHAHIVGRFKDLLIAEFPVEHTGLAGRTIRDTRLRELTGLNIVATWQRGRLLPASVETLLTEHSVAVVVGSQDQIAELDAMFVIYNANDNPVLVIGGGKVGQATARALRRRDVSVCLVERDEALRPLLSEVCDAVVIGDAADRNVIMKAGLEVTPTVVLTTNDDAMNSFLAVYCRRLNPAVHIVSRETHERNLEAIVKSLLALVLGSHATFVGEGVDLLVEPVPQSLAGERLRDAGISERTGLNVVALEQPGGEVENASAGTLLAEGAALVMLGTRAQRKAFQTEFR